jgi:NAD(P)-dependent dehydrogenase (short-subunit alcohol dehydrogenase family)
MKIDLAGRVAVVTGAAQGIGRTTARRLAESGASVALADLALDRASAAAGECGPAALGLAVDVRSRASVDAMVAATVDRFGRLDILVTCAGVLYPTRFEAIPEREWEQTFAVNVTGVFHCNQAAAAVMRRNGWGRIVNLSSTAGKSVSTLGGAHYTASKAAVLGLSRAAAKELAPHGITVNSVCPGLIETEMAHANASQDRLDAYARSFPIQRLGRAEEVADLIVYLSSEQAGYLTGGSFDINGGDLMV